MLVSDGAGIFKANQAKAIYRILKITKETIEKRRPWQNFVETTRDRISKACFPTTRLGAEP